MFKMFVLFILSSLCFSNSNVEFVKITANFSNSEQFPKDFPQKDSLSTYLNKLNVIYRDYDVGFWNDIISTSDTLNKPDGCLCDCLFFDIIVGKDKYGYELCGESYLLIRKLNKKKFITLRVTKVDEFKEKISTLLEAFEIKFNKLK